MRGQFDLYQVDGLSPLMTSGWHKSTKCSERGMGVSVNLTALPNFRLARHPGAIRKEGQEGFVNATRLIASGPGFAPIQG